jgi:hypothetical protein
MLVELQQRTYGDAQLRPRPLPAFDALLRKSDGARPIQTSLRKEPEA